jgi:hypothetical protein
MVVITPSFLTGVTSLCLITFSFGGRSQIAILISPITILLNTRELSLKLIPKNLIEFCYHLLSAYTSHFIFFIIILILAIVKLFDVVIPPLELSPSSLSSHQLEPVKPPFRRISNQVKKGLSRQLLNPFAPLVELSGIEPPTF